MAKPTYEYLVLDSKQFNSKILIEVNRLGSLGWRLVAMAPSTFEANQYFFWFIRELD